MVYTDGNHLIADSLQELYKYADSIGLNTEWIDFMGRNVHPHFDLFGHVKQRVLKDENVKQVSTRELVRILKLNYRIPENENDIKEWEEYHKKDLDEMEKPTESDYKRMIAAIMKKASLK